MQNIEIKAPIDDLQAMERRARAMGAEPVWTRDQRDVFFNVAEGYLKLRCAADEAGASIAGSGELIAYRRAPGSEPRPSDYNIVPVPEPALLEAALARSIGIHGVVEKTRRLLIWRHTRIHLDSVTGLGTFLELETVVSGITREEAETEIREVIRALALDPATFLDRPYLEMISTST